MPFLRYQHPGRGVIFVELGGKAVTLGRSKECTVYLDDSMLSRKHCEVRYQGGKFVLVDLQSKNGTHVNGVQIGTHELKEGDLVSIGNVTLLYREKK